ncbi:MAG: hypothetical protein HWE12_09310 [Oceanospirillaceae bacterium]|nr:hypothetical protein [Oceanospirillaceae bacterium]
MVSYITGMKNLKLRNGNWQVKLVIPADCREAIGKYAFTQSLGRCSTQEAEAIAHRLLGEWKDLILQVRGQPTLNLQKFLDRPASERLRTLKAITDELNAINPSYTESDLIDHAAKVAVESQIIDQVDTQTREQIADALGIACRPANHLEEYVSIKLVDLKDRSRDEHRRVLETQWIQAFPIMDEDHYTMSNVVAWWERLHASGKSKATLRKYLSHTKGFVKWLCYRGYCNKENYVESLEPITKRQQAKKQEDRKPFSDVDCKKLLDHADDQLKPLILFGMYTGCRIEELCNLTTDDLIRCPENGRLYIDVPVSKTKKGEHRKIPLHRELEGLIPESGYLIDVGKGINRYGERSAGIGKKFGRLKTGLGYGRSHVFHSLRKSFIDKLKQANAPEEIAADIVGHEVGTMTYGLYASETPVEQLFMWVDRVEYKASIT